MTTSIDNRIDGLISRVKDHGAMKGFCFISAYPPNKTPNPVKKYTVAVENLGVNEKRVFVGNLIGEGISGRLYGVRLRLRTYAPEHTSGAALLRAGSMLADALEKEDSDKLISEISFSDIDYDTSSRTEFRDVTVRLNLLMNEEAAA